MSLDLELLPDKPKTFTSKISFPTKEEFGLNFDLLPDKPEKTKPSLLTSLAKISTAPLIPFQPKVLTTGLEETQKAGARYPRAIFRGLEALQIGKPPLEAMKKGFVPEIFEPKEKVRTPTEIAWDMAGRLYQKPSTSVAWEFVKTLPFTTAGKLAEFQLDPSVFLMFQGINKVLTNPDVAKFIGKDIPAPKWVDDAIKATIKGFYRPFETLGKNVKESRINAITDELYKKFEPRMDELRTLYRQQYGVEPLEGDIRGLIKVKLIQRGIYNEPLIKLQAKLFKVRGFKPLEPRITEPISKPSLITPITPEVKPVTPTFITPKVTIPPVIPPVKPTIPTPPIVEGIAPVTPTGEGKVIPKELEPLAQEARKYNLINYGKGDMWLTEKTDTESLFKDYPNLVVIVKDVNGNRTKINISAYNQLVKHKAFTDRIKEVWTQGKQEEIKGGILAQEGFMEALKPQKLLTEGIEELLKKEDLINIEGIKLSNTSSISISQIWKFKEALLNNDIRSLLKENGIEEIRIDPPYKFSLSEQANINKNIISINADAINPTDTLLHELGHQKFKSLSKQIQDVLIEQVKASQNPLVKGYLSLKAYKEAVAELIYKDPDFYNQVIEKIKPITLDTTKLPDKPIIIPKIEKGKVGQILYGEFSNEVEIAENSKNPIEFQNKFIEQQLTPEFKKFVTPRAELGKKVELSDEEITNIAEQTIINTFQRKTEMSFKEFFNNIQADKKIYEVKKAKIIKNIIDLLPEDKTKLDALVTQIVEGEAGKRIRTEAGEWLGVASTFPSYFRDKGYTKKETLAIIDKVLEGKPVTEKQQAVFEDLLTGYKEQLKREVEAYEQGKQEDEYRAELVKAGYSESEVEAIIRETQKVSQSEVAVEGVGISGSKFFKTPEEANAYIEDVESKGGHAEVSRVTPEEVEVSYTLPETLTPSGEVKLELHPPLKKDLFQEKGELFEVPFKRPSKPSGEAFAMPEGGLEEWIKRQEEQQGIKLRKLETPELVKLAVELQGKYPIVKKLVTNLGLFKFGKGIVLDVKIFKNPNLTGMVLAHEIGHLIDWLPDFIIARGNLLGRIATLRMYTKSLLPEKPGMEATMLTDTDRVRLRREAETLLKEEAKKGEYEITEEIIKEIPIYAESKITAEEILSYWRSNETDIRLTNRSLYDFIAQLSGAEKLSIIQQALRGIIDERIIKLGGGKRIGTKIVKEQIKRVVTPVEVTPQNISRRFKQLLKEEIIKRKLFSNEVIKEELKRITQWWNPFDDTRKDWFTNYRYSSKELYAEAISVLLNAPEKLEELAPKFYSAFWRFIDRKPEVKQALLELQDFLALGEGEKLRIRSQDIRNMFKKGEELFYDKRTQYQAQQKSLYFKLKTELIDKNTAILNKLKEAEKQGKKINPEDNPKYYLEDWNYLGGKVKNLLDKINVQVIVPLTTQSITQEDLGEYLFLNRVVTERKDIANPLGQNRETAQKQLDYLLETLGQGKFDILKSSVDKFQGILKNLLDEANKVGFYKPETFAEIITNPTYATFQVLDYLDDYVTPTIIHQIGTLKGIANPFASTTLKMISTLRAIERVKTNNSLINFMKDNFPAEIDTAKIRRFGKYKAEVVEKEGYGTIKTREEGKLKGYYVDPYIADSVNYQPTARSNAVLSMFRFLNRSYFRPVYVNLNLGFQTFNLMRDFVRAWKLNPNITFPQMLKKYSEAIPIAKRRIWGDFTDPVITEMQQSGMLSFTYNNLMRGVEDEETQIEFLMRQYDILKKNPQNPVMKLLNSIEELGDFIETLPKVTGYLSRVKSGRNIKEIAHEVRVFSGSPDFLRKGTGYDWYNNIFLFSNAFKEGFRGDYEGAFRNPKTRSGYWWRTAKLNLLPKILMFLATLGFFGQRIKENYKKQTEFDKTNYTTFPLGETEDSKAIYLRIPNDEVGRLFSSILWKALNFDKNKIMQSIQQIASLTAGQLPSLAPEAEMVTAITQYAVGQNPYDFFRGRTILTDDEMKAGGWYSVIPMLKWTAGKAGFYGLTVRAKKNDQSPFEKIIQWTPIVQRYLRITAYGEEEELKEEKFEREQFKARRRLEKRK